MLDILVYLAVLA